jgi:hypothetical protein
MHLCLSFFLPPSLTYSLCLFLYPSLSHPHTTPFSLLTPSLFLSVTHLDGRATGGGEAADGGGGEEAELAGAVDDDEVLGVLACV